MTMLETLRKKIPWSQGELARQARLDRRTVDKAERGEPIQPKSAELLVEALGRGLGRKVMLAELEDLRVRAITE